MLHIVSRASYMMLRVLNLFSSESVTSENGPIVSIATYGERLNTCWLALESIAKGTRKPSRLLLWIDSIRCFQALPEPLKRLSRRGLEIRYADNNIGPHRKYYPFVESDTSNTPLVTADDDVVYPSYWLNRLLCNYVRYPDDINCYRARTLVFNGNTLASYLLWRDCTTIEAGYRNLATGTPGVLYPPAFLRILKKAGNGFMQCCPHNDDLWLHVQALRSGFKVRQISKESAYFPTIKGTELTSLNIENFKGRNDSQIKDTYTKEDIEILLREEL